MKRRAILLGALALFAAATAAPAQSRAPFVRAVFESGATLKIETADTPEARRQGLMGRRNLPEDWGMLFVFDRPDFLSFWMKNTPSPLSIAFLTEDGRITNIRKMRPFDETTRHRSARKALYALEVKQGWFKKNRIRAGQRVQLLRAQLLAGEEAPRMPMEEDDDE